MPIVRVDLWAGLPPKVRKCLIEDLTGVFVRQGIPAEQVTVLINEVPMTHWGMGGTPASAKHLPSYEDWYQQRR